MTLSQSAAEATRRSSPSLSGHWRLAVAGILLLALALRLFGLNWDSNQHLHPDERHIVMVTMDRVSLPFPNLADAHLGDVKLSTLNPRSVDPTNGQPRSFAYGSLPIFLLKFVGHLASPWWPIANGIDGLTLIGRILSTLFDLGTILLVFLIGRRLYGVVAGLVASLLVSMTVLDIQLAHFYASDTLLTFFVVLTILAALRAHERPSPGRAVAMGVAAGLAISCKVSAAPVLLACVLACWLARDRIDASGESGSAMGRAFSLASLSVLVAGLVFFIFQPYAVLDPQSFIKDIQYESEMVRGIQIPPYTIQYIGTVPIVYQIGNLFAWVAGPTLTIVLLVGMLLFALRLLARRRDEEWLLAAWIFPYLAITLAFQVKFVRYMLPVLPLLVLLGVAWLLPRGLGQVARAARPSRWATVILAAVVLGTALQAASFASIYMQEHTRVRASEWIYDNVPRGAALSAEHWDDSLPLNLANVPTRAGDYRLITFPMYDTDNAQKRENLIHQLTQVDYVILSSNRLYGSVAKVPQTYPLSNAYYRLLFDDKLGFGLAATFTSYPGIGPFHVADDVADESFTVYDHPKVYIFKKSASYSEQAVRSQLEQVPLDQVVPVKAAQTASSHNNLMLSDADRQAQQSGGTWSEMYNPGDLANSFPIVAWLLAIEFIGLIALPLTWRLFNVFPDRGYGLAKTLGLLAVAYLAWLFPSLHWMPFGRGSVLVGMALVVALSWLLIRGRWQQFRDFLNSHRMVVVAHEIVFLAFFALFLMIRMRNPDLWHLNYGGEKPMEFAFLNAVAKSTYFPPYDPWVAGGYMNYYYFGYVIVASLLRLTGIVPAVGFNLAIATVFGLTAAGLFSFGFNYVLVAQRLVARALPSRAVLGGIASAVFVLIVGNLDGPIQILEALWKLSAVQIKSTLPLVEGTVRAASGAWVVLFGGRVLPPFDFWRSTRVIGPEATTPITEFPFFTFLYGDLHPHMLAMPLAALALALALAIVWQGRRIDLGLLAGLPAVFVGGLVVGALQVTNSWDYPTYLLLLSATYLIASFVREGKLTRWGATWALVRAAATYAVATLLFLPFNRSYELFYNGVDPSPGKTSLNHYLVIFGFFLFCAGSLLAVDLAGNRWHRFGARRLWERLFDRGRFQRRRERVASMVRLSPWMELLPQVIGVLALVAALALLMRMYLIAVLLAVGIVVLLSLFDRRASPERLLLVVLVGLATALTIGVEFVTIKGDVGRMNTVFKFYLQAWFFMGIVSALGTLSLIWRWRDQGRNWLSGLRKWWIGAFALLLLSVFIYPVAATPVKVGLRFQPLPPTLDGMAYMQGPTYKDQNADIYLQRDYSALRWLQERVAGSPVVLEAQTPEYRFGSRVSIYTGLPTVMGWNWHERQQRWGYQQTLDDRVRDVKGMFDGTDVAQTLNLLRRYNVSLIYVGDMERAYYSQAGLSKFDVMASRGDLSVVYKVDGVTIYEVPSPDRPSIIIPGS
jgi:YYY domain-containing protein